MSTTNRLNIHCTYIFKVHNDTSNRCFLSIVNVHSMPTISMAMSGAENDIGIVKELASCKTGPA